VVVVEKEGGGTVTTSSSQARSRWTTSNLPDHPALVKILVMRGSTTALSLVDRNRMSMLLISPRRQAVSRARMRSVLVAEEERWFATGVKLSTFCSRRVSTS